MVIWGRRERERASEREDGVIKGVRDETGQKVNRSGQLDDWTTERNQFSS